MFSHRAQNEHTLSYGGGTPGPNGVFWAETMKFVRLIGEQKRIVGFNLVEFAPNSRVDRPDCTAAKLMYKLMNYAFHQSHTT